MHFVDRTEEMARLKAALTREKSSLVVVYGRRRLGKSTLLKKVLADDDVYFLADRSEKEYQRMLLTKVVAQVFPEFDKPVYPDWESLFRAINHRVRKPFTLCLDEFPYLVEQSPELPSVLQKLVDEKRLRYNLILCGSSQNMMYGLFLDSTAPLYGRADEMIRLAPIRLPYIQDALGMDAAEAVEEYAVWGGVPRYWELREERASLSDALWHHVFSVQGLLYEEPLKLLQDDVRDVVKASTLMSYIGTGANRLSEIAARSAEPATNLSRPIRKLMDLGFLEREVPYNAEEKNAKKSLYKIADPYMRFYYRFVVPNRSFIERGRMSPVKLALEEHLSEYMGMEWESLCRAAVTGNSIHGVVYGRAGRWWGTVMDDHNHPVQMEVDVVAESLDHRHLLVGECKWTAREDVRRLTAELLRKAALLPFAQGRKVIPVLFLKTAPAEKAENVLLPQDVIAMEKAL